MLPQKRQVMPVYVYEPHEFQNASLISILSPTCQLLQVIKETINPGYVCSDQVKDL